MLSDELLSILACPACKSRVVLVRNSWLVCQNDSCRRKYPIVDEIPVMLVEEGAKYIDVDSDDLPEPHV